VAKLRGPKLYVFQCGGVVAVGVVLFLTAALASVAMCYQPAPPPPDSPERPSAGPPAPKTAPRAHATPQGAAAARQDPPSPELPNKFEMARFQPPLTPQRLALAPGGAEGGCRTYGPSAAVQTTNGEVPASALSLGPGSGAVGPLDANPPCPPSAARVAAPCE